jgi:hypothetical protein
MALLICKILGSWFVLSAIAAYTWARCTAVGRCLAVNEMMVVVSPREKTENTIAEPLTARTL